MRQLGARKRQLYSKNLVGTKQKDLFEQHKDDGWIGLTDHYVKVKCGTEENLKNQMKEVHLEKCEGQLILGKMHGEQSPS